MILFTPGPANISERVRRAMTGPDIGHRDEAFRDLLREIRERILSVCRAEAEYECAVFSGSGTLAVEAALAALSGWDRRVLVVSNGVYGERAATACRLHRVPHEVLSLDWGAFPDPDRVEAALKREGTGAVYLVHHETTTGRLNPLKEIAARARAAGRLVLVDGVSSVGGEELETAVWGIDLLAGSANKCLRGVPGASFAVAGERFLAASGSCRRSALYADLRAHLEAEARGETPFTPAVPVFYAFREALREIMEEGLGERIRGYEAVARSLRQGLCALGLTLFLPEEVLARTMTPVNLPAGWNVETLGRACREGGYLIYASQGPLARTTFRLGTVGRITRGDVEGFLGHLGRVLERGPQGHEGPA